MQKLYNNKDWLKYQYIDKKMSIIRIAKLCNCSNTTIWDWLKKYKIPIRSHSESHKGQIPWIIGKHHTEKTKMEMSKSRKGRKVWNKGIKGEEWFDYFNGNIPGKQFIIGERSSPNTEFKKGQKGAFSGKHHSIQAKKKIMKGLIRRIPSSLEDEFQKIIDKHNLPYKYVGDGSFILGHFNPDFINTNNEKIAIEVYARYFKLRNNESIEKWKENRNKIFANYGWRIIYFDETEVEENNVLNKLIGV